MRSRHASMLQLWCVACTTCRTETLSGGMPLLLSPPPFAPPAPPESTLPLQASRAISGLTVHAHLFTCASMSASSPCSASTKPVDSTNSLIAKPLVMQRHDCLGVAQNGAFAKNHLRVASASAMTTHCPSVRVSVCQCVCLYVCLSVCYLMPIEYLLPHERSCHNGLTVILISPSPFVP